MLTRKIKFSRSPSQTHYGLSSLTNHTCQEMCVDLCSRFVKGKNRYRRKDEFGIKSVPYQILPMKLAFCAFPFLRYFPFSFCKSEVTRGRVMILRKFSASQKQKRFKNERSSVRIMLLAQSDELSVERHSSAIPQWAICHPSAIPAFWRDKSDFGLALFSIATCNVRVCLQLNVYAKEKGKLKCFGRYASPNPPQFQHQVIFHLNIGSP